MRITKTTLFVFLALQIFEFVYANENLADSDKASVIPTQKNSSIVNNAAKDDSTNSSEQSPSLSQADVKKAPPKDTSLNLTGNGGSTNRGAGGNAMLRKRFTF